MLSFCYVAAKAAPIFRGDRLVKVKRAPRDSAFRPKGKHIVQSGGRVKVSGVTIIFQERDCVTRPVSVRVKRFQLSGKKHSTQR